MKKRAFNFILAAVTFNFVLAAVTLLVFTVCDGVVLTGIAQKVDKECPVYEGNITLKGAEYSDKQIILRFSINERVTPMELNREDVSYAQWMSTLKGQWKWMWDQEKKDFFKKVAERGGGITFKFMSKQTGMVREIAFTNDELKYLLSSPEESSSDEWIQKYVAEETPDTFNIPPTWQEYTFEDAYSISVPNTMEYVDDDKKAMLSARGIYFYSGNEMFMHVGYFSDMSTYYHYACIELTYQSGALLPGETISLENIDSLDADVIDELKEVTRLRVFGQNNYSPLLVDNYLKMVGEPTYRLITVDGTKALEIKYRRTGYGHFITRGTIYILNKKMYKGYSNDSHFPVKFKEEVLVILTVAYREQEAELWQADLDNVIKTFKWRDAE